MKASSHRYLWASLSRKHRKLHASSLDEYRVYYHKRFKQNFLNNTYKFVLILRRATVTTTKLSIFLCHDWFISNYRSQLLLWHFWIGQVKMPNVAFISTLNSSLNVRNYRKGWLCHVLAFVDTYLKSCTFTNLLCLFHFILLITWPNFPGYNIAIINIATIASIKPWQCLESSCYPQSSPSHYSPPASQWRN